MPHNWHATRYSDGLRYGVWYGSLELETTVHETLYHWHRFVTDSFPLDREIVGERRVFQVRCEAILIDLRSAQASRAWSTGNDYGFTQQLGSYLSQRAQSGLLAPSARWAGHGRGHPAARSAVRRARPLLPHLPHEPDRRSLATVERTPGEAWLEIGSPEA